MNITVNNSSRFENHTFKCHLTNNDLVYASMYCLIIAAGIVGNSIVLVIFYPTTKQHSYSLLIWYLSFFDLIASLLIIPEMYEFITCYQYWPFGLFGCKILYPCYYISINISIFILIIMTIDRYRNIVTPFKQKLKAKNIHGYIVLSVIFSFALQWYQFQALHLGHQQCRQDKNVQAYTIPRTVTLLIRDIVFILLFTITTARISYTLKNRKKRMLTHNVTKNIKNKKTLNMLIMLGGTFSFLVLPYDFWDCSMLISRMLPEQYHISLSWKLEQVDMILSLLQMCNSVVNCLIYAKMHDHFHKIICKFWRRRDSIQLKDLGTVYEKYVTAAFELQPLSRYYRIRSTSEVSELKTKDNCLE